MFSLFWWHKGRNNQHKKALKHFSTVSSHISYLIGVNMSAAPFGVSGGVLPFAL